MQNTKPKHLVKGSRISVVSPASSPDAISVFSAMEVLKSMDMIPVPGRSIVRLRTNGMHSASVLERCSEIESAFKDESIDAIFVSRGGIGSADLLKHLDYDLIRSNPKIFIGFSDITALNTALLSHAKLISFNGPTCAIDHSDSETKKKDTSLLKSTIRLLMRQRSWDSKPFVQNDRYIQVVNYGRRSDDEVLAEGISIGGNLTVFQHLLGTRYLPDLSGHILFLEDDGISGGILHRMLSHLDLAGVFHEVSGVVFGRFTDEPEKVSPHVPSIDEVIVSFFADRHLPCFYGFNFSHVPNQATIPIGCEVKMLRNGSVCFASPLR